MTIFNDTANGFFFQSRDFLDLLAVTEKVVNRRIGQVGTTVWP